MDAEAKKKEIIKMYGTEYIKGQNLNSMSEKQIHAIYGRLLYSGKFEEYEGLKQSYISLFPNARYEATRRASHMSIFELQNTIPKVVAGKKELTEGYQFTLMDWLETLQAEEAKGDEDGDS